MFREFLGRLLRLKSVDANAPAWTDLKVRVGDRFFDDLLVPIRAGIPDSFEPYRLRGVLPHDQARDLMGMSFDCIEDGETIRIALSREDAEALSGLIRDYLTCSQSPRSSETPSSLKTTPGAGENV